MKIFGLTFGVAQSFDHDFDIIEAMKKYPSDHELYEKLEQVQRADMARGFYSVRLVVPKGSDSMVIRLQTDKDIPRQQAAKFLSSHGIPVS